MVTAVIGPLVALGHPVANHPGNVVRPQVVQHAPAYARADWRALPYSGGFLYAHAVRMGLIRPQSGRWSPGGIGSDLKCTPAPCAFKNVKASGGSQPVDETPIAASKTHSAYLISGANDYNCSAIQGYYESTNGGKTWTASCGQLISGGGDGDPIVGFDLNNVSYRGGIDSLSSGTYTIVVDHSSDGGTTWSSPIAAVQQEYGSGGITDKPWMQIDTHAGSPHKNAIYVSVTQFDASSDSDISVSHSTDGGATWKTVSTGNAVTYPSEVDQFSDIAIGKDGTVYVDFLQCPASAGTCANQSSKILMTKSTDGGTTWSKATLVENVTLAPGSSCGAFYGCLPNTPERLSEVPAFDIDNSTGAHAGTLYVVAYTYASGYCQVIVVQSTDGGKTWSKPVNVAPSSDKHDQFFPWLSLAGKTGYVGVTWLDRRDDPNNVNYIAYGAASKDGGVTYPNLKIGANASNPSNDGFGGGFMGDYTGNMWSFGKVYASWTDTSTGPPSSDFVSGFSP
jgi:hypothetical protein